MSSVSCRRVVECCCFGARVLLLFMVMVVAPAWRFWLNPAWREGGGYLLLKRRTDVEGVAVQNVAYAMEQLYEAAAVGGSLRVSTF